MYSFAIIRKKHRQLDDPRRRKIQLEMAQKRNLPSKIKDALSGYATHYRNGCRIASIVDASIYGKYCGLSRPGERRVASRAQIALYERDRGKNPPPQPPPREYGENVIGDGALGSAVAAVDDRGLQLIYVLSR